MHFSIRINAQPNYGYPQPGYPNTYPERAYYPSGPVNPEQGVAQSMGRELAYGDAQGAANLLRSELYRDPRHALRLVNEANRDAGPYARDRINQMPDGSLVIQDNYTRAIVPVTGRSPYAGFPPQGQVPGYYANANNTYYNFNGGVNQNNGLYSPTQAAWNYPPPVQQLPISFAFYGGRQHAYGPRFAGNYGGFYPTPYYRPRGGVSVSFTV